MSFPHRVAENILPRSKAQNLPAAFREWHFTGYTCDHGEAEEICQMCEKEQLRYHFEIKNRLTDHALMVGSTCILRFDVPVFDGDRELTKKEATKHLNDHMRRMRFESCMRALEALAKAEGNPILPNALRWFRQHGSLTPNFAFVVFWRLQQNKIDHDPTFFTVSLRRHQHQDDLRRMPSDRVHRFWKALTPSQRRMDIEFGHAEPISASAGDDVSISEIKRRVEEAYPGRLKLPKPI